MHITQYLSPGECPEALRPRFTAELSYIYKAARARSFY